jgi:hypothetical protein
MLLWALLHNPYHIAVINRHFQTWEWALLLLHHPGLQLQDLATSEDTIEETVLAEVAVVEEDLQAVDINVATLLRCLKPRRLQS